MSKTQQIAEELGLKLISRLHGGEQLPISGELQDGVYLVEKDGQKLVLKTGNFNEHEVEDTRKLKKLGIRAPEIIDSKDGAYVLYEYLGKPLATEDFWTDANIKRVLELQNKIRNVLLDQVPNPVSNQNATTWLQSRIEKEWLPPLVPEILSQETATEITRICNEKLISPGAQLTCIYRDNNADHYIDLGNELGIVDADISGRPREYMNMRYLSWVLLTMPMEQLGDPIAWAEKWAGYLNADEAHFATWLLSLVGILWDIHANEKHKGEHIEKTEAIKKILNWVIEKLNQQK